MTFSERFHEIRTGFDRPFWVANISELFERLSYYAAFASLARYLHDRRGTAELHRDCRRVSHCDWEETVKKLSALSRQLSSQSFSRGFVR